MMRLSLSVICVAALTATACFSGGDDHVYRVIAAQDMTATSADQAVKAVKQGDVIAVGDAPVYLEAPGHIGLLVLPPLTGTGDVKANLRPFDRWGGAVFEQRSNDVLAEVMDGLISAQRMMARDQAAAALSTVEGLIGKYPTISYLNFMKASCLVMLGQKNDAVAALEAALHAHPQHVQARSLYRGLAGKDFEEALAH